MILEAAFIVGAILILWFKFTLPVVVFQALKNAGFKKDLWPENSGSWSREEWSNWVWLNLRPSTAYMLNCPGCFGTRVAISASILLLLLRPEPMVDPKEMLLFMIRTSAVGLVGGLFLLELLQRLGSWDAPVLQASDTAEPAQDVEVIVETPAENPETWKARLMERGVKATNSAGQEITRLSNRDYAVASFFAEIEQGRVPCDKMDFPGCTGLVAKYKKALEAAGGSSCPPCKQGEIRRSLWEELFKLLPVRIDVAEKQQP